MHWNRRNFLKITGGMMAAVGVGTGVKLLTGSAAFNDWRALPGMTMTLTLNVDKPEKKKVNIIARTQEGASHVQSMKGAQTLEVEVPFLETSKEAYELIAVVSDWRGASLTSEPVEVLAQAYRFGL